MNIFATKDGKIYKVSLKNFVDTTGKKAPYYKRVKVGDKYVEKDYALCPGCNNPIHFVNLFNRGKKKKKKAHARHQRSSVKGLAKYNAAAYECCPFGSKKSNYSEETSRTESPISSFSKAMTAAFGLSQEGADLLGKIYFLLKNQDPEKGDHDFLALIASVSYNNYSLGDIFNKKKDFSPKDYLLGFFWNSIGDMKNSEQRENRLISLGITDADVYNLIEELRKQHDHLEDSSQSYYKKPDLTHLCATAATILTDKIDKEIDGLIASSFSGTISADASAGYIGDLCISDGSEPSMNNGDYKADLDAVNIAALIENQPNVSLLSIINEYYTAVESGQINRARLFKENIGLETLKAQREAYRLTLQQALRLSRIQRNSRLALFDKFINCIEAEKEEWPDEQ